MRRWLAALLIGTAAASNAHELAEARVHLDVDGQSGLRIEYDVALSDLELGFGLDRDQDGTLTVAEFDAAEPTLVAAWRDAIRLDVDGRRCTLHSPALQLRDYAATRYASLALRSGCAVARDLVEFRSDFLFEQDTGHRAIVVLDDTRSTQTQVAHSGRRALRFANNESDVSWRSFFAEGVHHLLIGYDHLAFLCCLLIAVVWPKRALQHKNALTAAVWVASAFTLAHSLTLSLAAFGIVRPASQPVEIAIAASVAFAAVNNLYPLTRVSPTLLAFVFGLVHGFGFAGALGELGLPRGHELIALLGFNLGVEAGQLLVIAVALPLFSMLARRPLAGPRLVALTSIAIAVLGGYWLVVRIIG